MFIPKMLHLLHLCYTGGVTSVTGKKLNKNTTLSKRVTPVTPVTPKNNTFVKNGVNIRSA